MWLQAQVFEQQINLVKPGQKVQVKVQALPGKVIEGVVDFIYPHLDVATRTAMVRVVLPNAEHELHENMYATAAMEVAPGTKTVLVPREAVVDSGVRQIVFVAEGNGHFSALPVTVGRSGRMANAEGQEVAMVEIVSGLAASQQVVTSGQFLLDSESRLQEAVQKMLRERKGMAEEMIETKAGHPKVDGVVEAYLPLAEFFGEEQEEETPADLTALVKAAGALAGEKDAGLRKWGELVLAKAKSMERANIESQRGTFKELSQIVVKMTKERGVSGEVGPVYAFTCPMDDAEWLRASREIANPFFAREMKLCGELKGVVRVAGREMGGGK
jgi:membrane fusion protein, copper/silver efflux system